jgi:cytochrome b subunit of formate dehydrogenase
MGYFKRKFKQWFWGWVIFIIMLVVAGIILYAKFGG